MKGVTRFGTWLRGWRIAGAFSLTAAGALLAAQNSPPRLTANQTVLATLGADTTLTRTNLLTTDTETTDPVEIVYTIFPDETGAVFTNDHGLYRGLTLLQAKGTFTQEDIDAGRVLWRSPSAVSEAGFSLPFQVRDFDGALASDGPFNVFSLRIEFLNAAPVAVDAFAEVPLNGIYRGRLSATNAESFQALSFRLVSQPLKGKVSLTDTNTGEFLYEVTTGQAGADSFTFQVFDGKTTAAQPGRFSLLITNQVPVIPGQTFSIAEDDELVGRLEALDPDRPTQKLTFTIISQPSKGVMEIFDADSGDFLYRPHADRFGGDSFLVAVSDGFLESTYVRITIEIEGIPEDGDLFVMATDPGEHAGSSNDDVGGIYIVNPIHGDVCPFVTHAALGQSILAMEFDLRRGQIYVAGNLRMDTNEVPVLGAIDLFTKALRPLIMGPPLAFPFGLTFDPASGPLYVANGSGGILRVDPDTGASTVVTPATNLLHTVTAVRLEPDGKLLVLDAVEVFDDNSRVVRLDPATGEQTLLTRDPRPLDPTDFQLLPDGRLLVSGRGGLFELEPASSNLVQLLPASSFSMLIKDMTFHGTNDLVMVDLFTKLVRYSISETNLITILTERVLVPSSMTIYREPSHLPEWRAAYFVAADLADPAKEATVWGDEADPDQDGAANLYEFALGTHPLIRASAPGWTYLVHGTHDQTVAEVVLRVRNPSFGATCVPQMSTDLIHWEPGPELADIDSAGDLFEGRVYRTSIPNSPSGSHRFFRLKISRE